MGLSEGTGESLQSGWQRTGLLFAFYRVLTAAMGKNGRRAEMDSEVVGMLFKRISPRERLRG